MDMNGNPRLRGDDTFKPFGVTSIWMSARVTSAVMASAATQIEDMNTRTDWYAFTAPMSQGGMGRGTFVDDAVRGYTLAL